MPLRHPWSLDLDSIKAGNLGRACLALHAYPQNQDVLLLADIRGDEFVRFDMPSGLLVSLLSLSHDGSALALSIRQPSYHSGYLLHINLGTAEQRAFENFPDGTLAAFAPDGASLAAIHTGEDDGVELSIIAVGNGVRSRFRIDDVASPGDYAVSWSPDGQLIAFDCYLHDDVSAVAVVQPTSGEVVRIHEGVQLLASSNGNWLDAETLLVVDEEREDLPPFKALDLRDGALSDADGLHDPEGLVRAVAGHDFISVVSGNSGIQGIRLGRLGERAIREIAFASRELPIRRLEVAPSLLGDL